jgi:predicted acetyltransferase
MEAQFMEFRKALASEDPQNRWLFEYHGESFGVFVNKLRAQKQGKQVPKGWVPASAFFLINDDGKIVGKSSLRHELNDFLRNIGGHIGYIIRQDERQNGYGTAILKLTLEKAKTLGLDRVLVTCDEYNIASAKIIEKNGGVFKDLYQNDDMNVPKRRYWIEL